MASISSARLSKIVAIVALAAALGSLPAGAAPKSPNFGRFIDAVPSYAGQSTCSPSAKPGVLAFHDRVLAAYPWTRSLGIVRACHIGGRSEHKEGRAWDWAVNAGSARDRAAVDDLFKWLTRTDGYGNRVARARRLGIMYVIWNRRIWFPSSGWRTYCVQRGRYCRDPDDGGIKHPHTDHVHFSFTWAGALKNLTYWHVGRSMATDLAVNPDGDGYWIAGRNSGVIPYGAPFYGDNSEQWQASPAVDLASRTGGGYWLLQRAGRVVALGGAPRLGGVRNPPSPLAAIAPTGSGGGYWIAGIAGDVFAFGDASHYGDKASANYRIAALAPTPKGLGYWLVTERGRVFRFGDALALGDLRGQGVRIAGIAPTKTGRGYWLATTDGTVATFGDAVAHGDLRDRTLRQPIVGIERTHTGLGYYLVNRKGRVLAFGDAAVFTRSGSASFAPTRTPNVSRIYD